jgi:hypothetical protein
MDWLKLGLAEGVGGVLSSCSLIGNWSSDGVVGVSGIEPIEVAGEFRLMARAMGRKMPAPGIEVVK